MSSDSGGEAGAPVDRAALVDYFRQAASGERRADRVGIEVELLPVDPASGRAWPYRRETGRGVEAAFLGLLERPGFRAAEGPVPPTTLHRGAASINLEPGGQLELSGAPHANLIDAAGELDAVLAEFAAAASEAGFALLAHGVQPVSTAEEIEMVPKRRYRIMAAHLARAGGRRYRDMMTLTGSVQASFDYRDEADAGRKMRLATLMAPIVTAIFANSPVAGGRDTGAASIREAIWEETDPARCGAVESALDGEWSFERYVEELLDVPAILVRAGDGGVESAEGRTFRDLLASGVEGRCMVLADWELHLSTIFTVARMKRVIEVRSADGPPPGSSMAAPALATGLLYHRPSLDAALALLSPLRGRLGELSALAGREGLRGCLEGGPSMGSLALELVRLASAGLTARGLGEERYLAPAEDWCRNGRSPSEEARELFNRKGIAPLVEAARIR